jgi:hypothetical protein
MTIDRNAIVDEIVATAGYQRPDDSPVGIVGIGVAELWSPVRNLLRGPRRGRRFVDVEGRECVLAQSVAFGNLVTQVGDQYYGERAAGIGSPPAQVTGMRLGIGTTAVAKTGAGAAIVTYTTASQLAIDGGFPTSALSTGRKITWKTTWPAGTATATGLAEVVITNETPITNVAGTAANTISRALLSPVVNKGAADTLAVTWDHTLLGA